MFGFCEICKHFHSDYEVCVPKGEFCEYSDCCVDGDWVRPIIGDAVEAELYDCTFVGQLKDVTSEEYVITGTKISRRIIIKIEKR